MFAWDDLKVFLAAHRAGSLSKAAASLGVSLSTVSRRLTTLEEQVGAVLFTRTPDGLMATEAGEAILQSAETMERAAQQLPADLQALSAAPEGVVRVAAPGDVAGLVVLPAMRAVLAEHPGLRLVLEESIDLADLARREVDVGIRIEPPANAEGLVAKRVRTVRWCLAGERSFVASLGPDPDLASLPWLGFARGFGGPAEPWMATHLPDVVPRLQVRTQSALRLAVRAGYGVAWVPVSFVWCTPGLTTIPVDDPPPGVPLWLIAHRAARHVPAVAVVWDAMSRALSETSPAHDAGTLRRRVRDAYGWDDPDWS